MHDRDQEPCISSDTKIEETSVLDQAYRWILLHVQWSFLPRTSHPSFFQAVPEISL